MSGNTIWQSGDSLNPTNMNNQTMSSLTILGTFSSGTISTATATDFQISSTFSSQGTSKLSGTWSSFISASGVSTSVLTATTATITTGTVTNLTASSTISSAGTSKLNTAWVSQLSTSGTSTSVLTATSGSVPTLVADSTISSAGTTKVNVVWASDASTSALSTSALTVTTADIDYITATSGMTFADVSASAYIIKSGVGRAEFGDIPSGGTIGGPIAFGIGMYSTMTHSGWSNFHCAVVSHEGATNTGSAAAWESWAMQNSASGTTQNRVQGAISGAEQYGASWLTAAYAFTGIIGTQAGGGHIHDAFEYWATTPYVLNGGSIGTAVGLKVDNITGATNNFAIKTGRGDVSFGDRVSITTSTAATSGNPTPLLITQTQPVASTGGPVGTGVYVTSTHTTGDLVSAYGLDVGMNHKGGGVVSTSYGIEIWGGVDTGGGIVEDLRMLYIQGAYDVPGSNITTVYGIKIDDQTAAQTNNYAIHTGKGIVRIGDALSLTSATNLPSDVSGTGYLYADSASSLYYVNGSGVSTLLA